MKFLLIFSLLFCLQFVFAGNNPAASFSHAYRIESSPNPKTHKQEKPPFFEDFSKNVLIGGAFLLGYYGLGIATYIIIILAMLASNPALGIALGLGVGLLAIVSLVLSIVFTIKSLQKDFKENPNLKGKVWAGVILALALLSVIYLAGMVFGLLTSLF